MGVTRPRLAVRLAWFVALWLVSVSALAVLGLAIRAVLVP